MLKYQRVITILVTLGVLWERSDAYSPYQSYSPAAGYAAGYGGYSSATGYGTCGALKITEVLDQIYCNHGYYTRFTSTDLAAIKVVLYELGLVTKFAHIEAVLKYVEQAIYFLEDLKDETYKSYDTSQLSKYYQDSGYDYSDLKGYLANETTALQEYEDVRRSYRKKFGMITWGTFVPDSYASEYDETYTKTKRMTPQLILHPTTTITRHTRGYESEYDYAGDYTCAYISSSYCSANSLVVKNVLYRVLKAIKSLDDALNILYDYIKNHDCGNNNDNKYALLVTADTFGSVLCAASVLLEAAKYQYTIYTGMAGATTYTNNMYGRASGGSGYSSAYQGFPYSYIMPSAYRYRRTTPFLRASYTPLVVG